MKIDAPEHPKIGRLVDALSGEVPLRPEVAILACLELLWHWAARYAHDGGVGRWPDSKLESIMGWRGEPGLLVQSLLGVGLLDHHTDPAIRLVVHDWFDHAEDFVHRRLGRSGRAFADGRMPRLTRLDKKERAEARRAYAAHGIELDDHMRPVGARRAPNGAPLGAVPGPGPGPEPMPSPTSGREDGAPSSDRPPSPTPTRQRPAKPRTGNSRSLAISSSPPRDPAHPPDWCSDEEWQTACEIADQLETSPVDGTTPTNVIDPGGSARADAIAIAIQDADKPGRPGPAAIQSTLRRLAARAYGTVGEPARRRLDTIRESLMKYPDGAAPSTIHRTGANGAGASRVEEAWRLMGGSRGGIGSDPVAPRKRRAPPRP